MLAMAAKDAIRADTAFVMTNLRAGTGIGEIARFVEEKGGLGV